MRDQWSASTKAPVDWMDVDLSTVHKKVDSQSYQAIPREEENHNERLTFDIEHPSQVQPAARPWKYSFEAAEIEARYRTYNETGRWQRPCILIVAVVSTSLFISLPFVFNIFAQGPVGKLVW